MPRLCPICQKPLEKKYTWKDILSTIFCFPCVWYCCDRTKMLNCKSCDIEVLISDGTFPLMARTYQAYKDFKWQFLYGSSKELDTKGIFNESQQTTQHSHLDLVDSAQGNGKSEILDKDSPKRMNDKTENKETNAGKCTNVEMEDSV